MTYEFNSNQKLNQNQYLKSLINKFLDEGIDNKIALYDKICEIEPDIARSTIRRVTQEFIKDLYKKASILEDSI